MVASYQGIHETALINTQNPKYSRPSAALATRETLIDVASDAWYPNHWTSCYGYANTPMANQTVVTNYGWSDATKTPSHSYLEPAILSICQKLNTRRVLDLGCGNGALCNTLANAGYSTVGCDEDAKGVDIARKNRPDIPFHAVGVYDDPSLLGETGFDTIVSTEVIEHLFLPRSLPKFAYAVLKPGGHLIISTPYHGYLKNLALTALGKWDHHHAPLWDGGHIKFWSRKSLSVLLETEGFSVKTFVGVGRAPFLWKSMILVAQKL